MYLYVFALLAVIIAFIIYRRNTTPLELKPIPSDFFPYKGIVTDIIKKSNESKDVKHHISDKQISLVKKTYNETVIKFFKLLNPQTKDLLKFEEGQFEKIVASVRKVMNEEMIKEDKDSTAEDRTMRQEALGKIVMPILFGNYVIGGRMGPNLHATYNKYKEELLPLLNAFYKGPIIPTKAPAEMGMKPMPLPTVKLPSIYFPYLEFIEKHLHSIMLPGKRKNSFIGLSPDEKNKFKTFYDIHVKKFFDILNKRTKAIKFFKPNQFEGILQNTIFQISFELNQRSLIKAYAKEDKLIKKILPELIKKLLKDKLIIKENGLPNYYASFKKNMFQLQPFLKAFYKGPPLPTESPLKCAADEKKKNERCVKIMCPKGETMTGNHFNGQTECLRQFKTKFGSGSSGRYYSNDLLPERVSAPTTPASSPRPTLICTQHEKMKNGKCVRVKCPLGTKHDRIVRGPKGFLHSCIDENTGMVSLTPNEKLHEAICTQYDSKGKCAKWTAIKYNTPKPPKR
jgi:hypothetical protein